MCHRNQLHITNRIRPRNTVARDRRLLALELTDERRLAGLRGRQRLGKALQLEIDTSYAWTELGTRMPEFPIEVGKYGKSRKSMDFFPKNEKYEVLLS